jgi:hypothetical protein
MMIMNVFPIGFFFPKQDFVQPLTKRDEDADKVREAKVVNASAAVEDIKEQSFGMPLYAYRFF